MNADTIAFLLVCATAPAITTFALLYGIFKPWYRSLLGWALMESSTGLALLVDISIAYMVFGDDYYLRDVVRIAVYSIICCGAWLKLIALLPTFRRREIARQERRDLERSGS